MVRLLLARDIPDRSRPGAAFGLPTINADGGGFLTGRSSRQRPENPRAPRRWPCIRRLCQYLRAGKSRARNSATGSASTWSSRARSAVRALESNATHRTQRPASEELRRSPRQGVARCERYRRHSRRVVVGAEAYSRARAPGATLALSHRKCDPVARSLVVFKIPPHFAGRGRRTRRENAHGPAPG